MSGISKTTDEEENKTLVIDLGSIAPTQLQETKIIEHEKALEFDETQNQAIKLCTSSARIAAVTGPAGTGKTTIMKRVASVFIGAGYRVVACAPTGKAARRIKEATGLESMTIHRLLQYPFPGERHPKTGEALRQGYPQKDRYNPLEYDVVLADEYAMVNQEVHSNLVDALPAKGMLRCFGDVHQLPPIEPIKINRDESPFQYVLKHFGSMKLERIHRQDEGSGIIAAGIAILKGKGPKRASDFEIKMTDRPVEALSNFVLDMKDKGTDFGKLMYQIITPTKKSWVGTAKLNSTLQSLLNDVMKDAISLPRHPWAIDKGMRVAIGDKILWTQNNYELNILNGETGIIQEITDLEEIIIDWGDRITAVPPILAVLRKDGSAAYVDPRKDIDLAYAITTHKSQGSEFIHVVYIINKSSAFMQDRANYYTGITRAREKVTVISDQVSFFRSLQPPMKRQKKGLDE